MAVIAVIEARRAGHLEELREQHRQAEAFADTLRQQRALTETKIRDWKKVHRADDAPARERLKSEAIARAIAKVREKEDEERRRAGARPGRRPREVTISGAMAPPPKSLLGHG